MTLRVDVKPELFRWARERAEIEPDALVKRFPKYREWESGEKQPTFKQLEQLAKATHAPIGSFFLSEPMQEPVPLPDLRTVGNRFVGLPSVDLLDTVYQCQQRQDWYREFARPHPPGARSPTGRRRTHAGLASSCRALEILDATRALGDGASALVFTGRPGKAIDEKQLRRMLRKHQIAAVAHGFRSSFRDWAAEETNHPREVIEAALAHIVQNRVEAAYARSDLFERRRILMGDWARYLAQGMAKDSGLTR